MAYVWRHCAKTSINREGRHLLYAAWPVCSVFFRHYNVAPWQRTRHSPVRESARRDAYRRSASSSEWASKRASGRVEVTSGERANGTRRVARFRESSWLRGSIERGRTSEESEEENETDRDIRREEDAGGYGEQTGAVALAARLPILSDGVGAAELHLRARP